MNKINMKYYVEILHPVEDKILWHYYLDAPDSKAAEYAVRKKVIEEHSNGFLLDTGGLFLIIVEEDKRDENGKWPKE
jgi:hypothetical protein